MPGTSGGEIEYSFQRSIEKRVSLTKANVKCRWLTFVQGSSEQTVVVMHQVLSTFQHGSFVISASTRHIDFGQ